MCPPGCVKPLAKRCLKMLQPRYRVARCSTQGEHHSIQAHQQMVVSTIRETRARSSLAQSRSGRRRISSARDCCCDMRTCKIHRDDDDVGAGTGGWRCKKHKAATCLHRAYSLRRHLQDHRPTERRQERAIERGGHQQPPPLASPLHMMFGFGSRHDTH